MAHSVEQRIADLIGREGGYVNHPDDRGGPTRFGVTEAVARASGYDGPMRDLPYSLAADIYRRRYWLAPGFDRVAAQFPALATELFDTGVNMGPGIAISFLQRALNALNRRARDWPDIQLSRRIDKATLAALAAFAGKRGVGGEAVLVKTVNALQGARYIELAEARPANEEFLFGWLSKRIG